MITVCHFNFLCAILIFSLLKTDSLSAPSSGEIAQLVRHTIQRNLIYRILLTSIALSFNFFKNDRLSNTKVFHNSKPGSIELLPSTTVYEHKPKKMARSRSPRPPTSPGKRRHHHHHKKKPASPNNPLPLPPLQLGTSRSPRPPRPRSPRKH